jgi:hypothetical protein
VVHLEGGRVAVEPRTIPVGAGGVRGLDHALVPR